MQTPADPIAVAGYVLAAPFCLYPPLFKRMWNGRRTGLFLVQEAGVALVVAGWALRGDRPAALGNAAYGVALAAAYGWHLRRAGARSA